MELNIFSKLLVLCYYTSLPNANQNAKQNTEIMMLYLLKEND